jgi:hypothetical protein
MQWSAPRFGKSHFLVDVESKRYRRASEQRARPTIPSGDLFEAGRVRDPLVDESAIHERDFGGAHDAEHHDALRGTGFWGRAGAGAVVLARRTGRLLLSHRSRAVEQPGTWGNFGGAVDPGQDPAASARREVAEECGYVGPLDLVGRLPRNVPSWPASGWRGDRCHGGRRIHSVR